MESPRRRERFLAILWNRKTDDARSLSDLLYPYTVLLSLIPSEFHSSLGISSADLSGRYGAKEIYRILGAVCLYQIGIALSKKKKGLAYGLFIIYSQNFLSETDELHLQKLSLLLAKLSEENSSATKRVINKQLLPFLKVFLAGKITAKDFTKIREGEWTVLSQSQSYDRVKMAADRLIGLLEGKFPRLAEALGGQALPPKRTQPAMEQKPYVIWDHFQSDDEAYTQADVAISQIPPGEIENRIWYKCLSHKVFRHLSNKRLARRAMKIIFQKMQVHHIETDLLARQRRFLLARLRGVVPAPELFLDRSFGYLCLKKLRDMAPGAADLAVVSDDLNDIYSSREEIFERLSKGVFFLDMDCRTMFIDRRSAMFHAAYYLVDGLAGDQDWLPKLHLELFDLYSFIGRIAMDSGREQLLIHRTCRLIESGKKECDVRNLLVAGSLLAYADLHPENPGYSRMYRGVVQGLAGLWKRRHMTPRILDQAAEVLNILDVKKLIEVLREDLAAQQIDTIPWTYALRRYAYLDHPVASEIIKQVVDAMPRDYPDGPSEWPPSSPNPMQRYRGVHYAISEFSSPYRESLLEYLALKSPMAMRQCIHDIARSNSPSSLRRLYSIASSDSLLPLDSVERYADRMLRMYATVARSTVLLRQMENVENESSVRREYLINRAGRMLENISNGRPKSPYQTFRDLPIAICRRLLLLLRSDGFQKLQAWYLLTELRNFKLWPLLPMLLEVKPYYLQGGKWTDHFHLFRETLLTMSNRNTAHILEKEINSTGDPDYQALIVECAGIGHALRLDSQLEGLINSSSPKVAAAAIRGLTTSIEMEAAERLVKIGQEDKRMFVHEAAMESLGKIRHPIAIPYLTERVEANPNDTVAIELLAGYELPKTEEKMVEAVRNNFPGNRFMHFSSLLRSGHKTAISGFLKFAGPKFCDYLAYYIEYLNPASPKKAVDIWISACQIETEGSKKPLFSILAKSEDPRPIPILVEYAYTSRDPKIRSSAGNCLINEVDFTLCPSVLEIILTHSRNLRKKYSTVCTGKPSNDIIEEYCRERQRDDDILHAYIASFRKKGFEIPTRWKGDIPLYLFDDSYGKLRY